MFIFDDIIYSKYIYMMECMNLNLNELCTIIPKWNI